jgi:zinc protease
MLARGGTRKLPYSEIIQAMYPMATSFGSQVDKEMTVFYGTTHRDNQNKYFDLIGDKLLDPGWRAEDFARVKSDALNFLKVTLGGTNDEELGKEALYNFIYAGQPYGHENSGTISSLERLTIDDARAFYRANYRRGNLVLGLAGGYPAEFASSAKTRFERLPAGTPAPVVLPEPAAISGTHVRIVKKETRATAISLGYPIRTVRGHKDWIALYLVQSYLGQHRSSTSHLYQRIRELRGMNYGDYAYVEYFPRGSSLMHPEPNLARRQQIFQIWIRPVEPQNAHFALRTALYEVDKLVREGMKPADFDSTRRFLSKFVNVLTRTADLALGYAIDSRVYGTPEFTEYVRKGLESLTLEDVNRVIRTELRAKDLKVVMVAPDAERLKEALVKDAPSPIRYNAPKPAELLAEDKVIEKYPLPTASVEIVPVAEIFR